MRYYLLLTLCIPVLLQAADSSNQNMPPKNLYSMIQERQYNSSKELASITAQEKDKIIESAGAYRSPLRIPISIKDALATGILPIISKLPSESFSTLRILPGYYTHAHYNPIDQITYDTSLKYINNADGLNKQALFYANGRLYGPLGTQPLEVLTEFSPGEQAEIIDEVQTLFLQNTSITEILPSQIALFSHLQRIVLTPETPENTRQKNSRFNPGITFEYR